MNIDEVSESMPYMKDVLELYGKVKEFEHIDLNYRYGTLDNDYHAYIKEDIDNVLDSFSRIFSLSPEQLVPVKEAMKSGIIDFMLLPQGDTAAFATPIMSEEMLSLLYIISRMYFRSIRASINVDNIYWEEGRCPVCNAVPALSVLEEEARRRYYCSFCGTIGFYKRIGCPNCHNEDPKLIDIIYVDDTDMRIDACNQCESYFKSVDVSKTILQNLEETDILSLPVDIIAQNKGYKRRSPNPVGMLNIA
ncbi:formate dehydrogenase accessory protein FdhE [bacterium BMS3Abin07]|nr:formate dehydrogenase accessory protein FdhE [bacterium BMS3Abin07]GBE32973.1 formate dehydrogenase accessory protein FdhE [bacterium BMS3Bbin05]HDL21020.1 formate dehydrogenase accessory protein FdhE [Nitrospirota bacterium]HDO22985.1 formate dehydrogenase accessory protein FdhE [Nitrospirota bacterium]